MISEDLLLLLILLVTFLVLMGMYLLVEARKDNVKAAKIFEALTTKAETSTDAAEVRQLYKDWLNYFQTRPVWRFAGLMAFCAAFVIGVLYYVAVSRIPKISTRVLALVLIAFAAGFIFTTNSVSNFAWHNISTRPSYDSAARLYKLAGITTVC
jgi:fatty-acid desaturase